MNAQLIRLKEIVAFCETQKCYPTEEELDQILADTKAVFTAEVFALVRMLVRCIREER